MKKIVFVFVMLVIPIVAYGRSYDVYVDIDNDTGTEDGTKDHPYNTIVEGVEAASNKSENHRKVFVYNGQYHEKVEIEEDVKLYGEDKNKTIIYGKDSSGDEFSYAVKMKNGSKIKNLTVKYGKTGVLVDKNCKATIKKCKIKKSDKIGVEVLKADRNNKKIFTLEDSKVYDGDGKALYIRKRKIFIKENEIYDNDEEGIDLRSRVKGKIYDNEIYGNSESGIEFEVRRAKLKIKDNKIKSNKGSGINAQYRGKNPPGEILVANNSIRKNSDFGLCCSRPSGGTPPMDYFSSSITLFENVFEGNDDGIFSQMCHM